MSIFTFVVDFGDGPYPCVGRDTRILGGELVAVGGGDVLAELERVNEKRNDLLKSVRRLLPYAAHADRELIEFADNAIAHATRDES